MPRPLYPPPGLAGVARALYVRTMANSNLLSDRAVLSVAGPEARAFLQGLVTADMTQVRAAEAGYAALLTPQGKILFEFLIAEAEPDRFLIDAAAARSADLIKRLMIYRLRTKVEIAREDRLVVAAFWNGNGIETPEGGIAFADPRLAALGRRVIATRAALAGLPDSPARYHAHRIALGVPDSADLPPDQIFALDAGLEQLNGVSFRKGCYVGQEVTARMKHRATARRRFLIATMDAPLPPPGTAIAAGGRDIGVLATGEGDTALALVRLDRLAHANGADTVCAGHTVTLRKPDWLAV